MCLAHNGATARHVVAVFHTTGHTGTDGDTGQAWVGLCPKPRCWSWFGGCPRIEAQRVLPIIDENSIYMYTLKYIMERGEVEDG